MKLLAVAGELSGDAHGGPLIRALRGRIPEIAVRGIGGPQMREAGLDAIYPLSALQIHGLVEVIRHLPRLFRILGELEREMVREPPDALLCIDYPGFNLRLAAVAKRHGIPVVWYSSPQVWAWRRRRLRTLARLVDRMVVLFPFEVDVYRKAGVPVVFAGHPLVGQEAPPEAVTALQAQLDLNPDSPERSKSSQAPRKSDTPVVAVMPGSRPSELRRNLPPVLDGIRRIREAGFRARFILPLAPSLDPVEADALVANSEQPVEIVPGGFLPLLKLADLAIVASGTATLQVGLAGIPFLVVYRVSPITYWIARSLAYLKQIAIVNILAGRELVPELLQQDLTGQKVCDQFLSIARNPERQAEIREGLAELATSLGPTGAYARGAGAIADFLLDRRPASNAG